MINKLEKFIYKWFVKSDKFHSPWFIGRVTPGVFALLIQPGKLAKKKTIFIFHVNRFLQIVNFLKCSVCPRGHQILKENVSAMVNILYFFCLIPTSFKNYDMISGFGDY